MFFLSFFFQLLIIVVIALVMLKVRGMLFFYLISLSALVANNPIPFSPNFYYLLLGCFGLWLVYVEVTDPNFSFMEKYNQRRTIFYTLQAGSIVLLFLLSLLLALNHVAHFDILLSSAIWWVGVITLAANLLTMLLNSMHDIPMNMIVTISNVTVDNRENFVFLWPWKDYGELKVRPA